MNTIHILVEYDKYVDKYKTLYGNDKTIVLIQLGSFYEMCYNENDGKGESNLRYICDEILQIIPGEKSYKDHDTNESKKYILKPVRGSGTKNVFLINVTFSPRFSMAFLTE